MRRIFIFREGDMMGAMIGPDLLTGVGGFGETVPDALHDLADHFDQAGGQRQAGLILSEEPCRAWTCRPPK